MVGAGIGWWDGWSRRFRRHFALRWLYIRDLEKDEWSVHQHTLRAWCVCALYTECFALRGVVALRGCNKSIMSAEQRYDSRGQSLEDEKR